MAREFRLPATTAVTSWDSRAFTLKTQSFSSQSPIPSWPSSPDPLHHLQQALQRMQRLLKQGAGKDEGTVHFASLAVTTRSFLGTCKNPKLPLDDVDSHACLPALFSELKTEAALLSARFPPPPRLPLQTERPWCLPPSRCYVFSPNPNSTSMAPSRRHSNGRSPLVRKQCQITSFFSSGGKSPVSSSNSNHTNRKRSPSPTSGPSSSQGNEGKKKTTTITDLPSAVSPVTPSTAGKNAAYAAEVIGKRIKVFWPLDKTWYEGCVRSFHEASGKHVIQYDDAEEEFLDLEKEKIEWAEEEQPRNLRRLRRMSGSGSSVVLAALNSGEAAAQRESSGEASTDDEDWGKDVQKDDMDSNSETVDLEDEGDVEEVVVPRSRRRLSSSSSKLSSSLGKRRKIVVDKLGCINNQILKDISVSLTGEVADRFGKRQAEKFKFLGIGRRDAHGRRLGDNDYDPRTLYLPQEFLKSLSGGQMGKFYELFEMDAHVGCRELDLQYMKGEQPHCGFPEKNFSMNLEKLARKGYRVIVVEQTETPEQLEIRRKEMGIKDKVVKREVCAVVTKGTLVEGESLLTNPGASYLMSITENLDSQNKVGTVLGICVVDVSTSKFLLGQIEDDLERHCLCSILSELRPVEILKPSKVLGPETERVLMQNTRSPLVNDLVPSLEFWDAEKTILEIKKVYSSFQYSGRLAMVVNINDCDLQNRENDPVVLPDILSELVGAGQNGSYALSALGGCIFYLRQAFLDEALLKCAKFELLPCIGSHRKFQKPYMILDASALESLEILENRNGNPTGTLYAQLDHCVTASGKRLLKSWLARPLYDIGSIVARQDAISVFKGVGHAFALEFRKMLMKLPDMERLLSRLFASCGASGRNAVTVILYEDAARKKLQDFLSVLRGCQLMVQASASLTNLLASTGCSLIHHLLTPGKRLPDVSKILNYFEEAFDWSEVQESGRIIPCEGCDSDYDSVCKSLREVEYGLKKHLMGQRKLLGNSSINYVTVGKDSYLLEVPETMLNVIPQDYELRSSKKGYFRYWTSEIKKYISELSSAEAEKESKLKGILLKLIEQFCEHHSKWRQLVSVTAEIDVLISLAVASDYYEGPACRPIIQEATNSNNSPFLSAKSLGHPTLHSDALGNGSFVPNDVRIGGSQHPSFILLTGPNMGGKSTLLHQVCMALILAQIHQFSPFTALVLEIFDKASIIGADVPAESFMFSLVDHIFVRMGARDQIMAGQSTFLMELSETSLVLSSATQHSFVALDELGRGTSTSDGHAIAGSVLEYLVHKIECMGMFSTHYHRLAADFAKESKVSVCHMACQVGMGAGGVEEVTFLYRLSHGPCPKSYGVNVARLADGDDDGKVSTPPVDAPLRKTIREAKETKEKEHKVLSVETQEYFLGPEAPRELRRRQAFCVEAQIDLSSLNGSISIELAKTWINQWRHTPYTLQELQGGVVEKMAWASIPSASGRSSGEDGMGCTIVKASLS
ncbi:DNA mismatch repair protein MSH6 [Apostasia shenzhenica]|uniref:DNA mismatch repair protein n=1 Tax=Apostasia shenzhenica TaxID=1088818 RepID=A0A2I0BBH7_9ASPA|nr:DNA mismatch repair protein MSH6 [Apostasia shenzhenica]